MALQAETGELRWEFKLFSPPWAGVLSTAGGLVFSGSDEGNFCALDARTGKPVWNFQTGGAIGANPSSFMIDGHQCLSIAADRVLYVLACNLKLACGIVVGPLAATGFQCTLRSAWTAQSNTQPLSG